MHSNLWQQINAISDLVDSHLALRVLTVIKLLLGEYCPIAMAEVKNRLIEPTGYLFSICGIAWPVIEIKRHLEDVRVEKCLH